MPEGPARRDIGDLVNSYQSQFRDVDVPAVEIGLYDRMGLAVHEAVGGDWSRLRDPATRDAAKQAMRASFDLMAADQPLRYLLQNGDGTLAMGDLALNYLRDGIFGDFDKGLEKALEHEQPYQAFVQTRAEAIKHTSNWVFNGRIQLLDRETADRKPEVAAWMNEKYNLNYGPGQDIEYANLIRLAESPKVLGGILQDQLTEQMLREMTKRPVGTREGEHDGRPRIARG